MLREVSEQSEATRAQVGGEGAKEERREAVRWEERSGVAVQEPSDAKNTHKGSQPQQPNIFCHEFTLFTQPCIAILGS